ncbi:hypothetical protein GEMRC1_010762 [Eukaryota sp. GEM-RC1]
MITSDQLESFLDDPTVILSQYPNLSSEVVSQRTTELLNANAIIQQLYSILDSNHKLVNTPSSPVLQSQSRLFNSNVSPFSLDSKSFQRLMEEFYNSLNSVEDTVVSQLSVKISVTKSSASEAIMILTRYSSLLSHSSISKKLLPLLDSIAETLLNTTEVTLNSLRSFTPAHTSEPTNSHILHYVSYLHSIASQSKDLRNSCGKCLNNCSSFTSLASLLDDLRRESLSLAKKEFKRWVSEVKSTLVNDGDVSRALTGKVLDIQASDGHLTVCFPTQAIALSQHVQVFSILGYSVPQELEDLAKEVSLYQKYVSQLQHVAGFYNDVSNQIIPSQKLMLLDDAQKFEKVIGSATSSGQIVWSSLDHVDQFAGQLVDASQLLEKKIQSLRSLHLKMEKIVGGLFTVDLTPKVNVKDGFSSALSEMSEIFQKCRAEKKDTKIWEQYWSRQVFLAFKSSFNFTLSHFPVLVDPIKASLDVAENRVVLKPGVEQLRQKYIEMIGGLYEKAAEIDLKFGCRQFSHDWLQYLYSDSKTVYLELFEFVCSLFESLEKIVEKFNSWVQPGLSVSLETYFSNDMHSLETFKQVFNQFRKKSIEVSKLPNERSFGGILVSFAPFKSSCDTLLIKMRTTTAEALINDTNRLKQSISDFLKKSDELLKAKPQSIDELGSTAQQVEGLKKEVDEIENKFKEISARNKILKMTEDFEVDVSDQSNDPVDPSDPNSVQGQLISIERFNKEADDFEKLLEIRTSEAQHFNLSLFDTKDFLTSVSEITALNSEWSLFSEFSNELSGFSKKSWFVLRTELDHFEDFLTLWEEKIKAIDDQDSSVSKYLIFQISKLVSNFPLLKIIRGDVFSEDHWHKVFNVLRINCKVPSELLFGQLLDKLDDISKNAKIIQDIQAQALGETTIKEVLREIDTFFNNFSFDLSTQLAADGKEISVIKDWTSVKMRLSDQDALLVSLKESPYFKNFQTKVVELDTKFLTISDIVHNLADVQRKWLHLQPVLLRNALPGETSAFSRIHKKFIEIMTFISQNPVVFKLLDKDGLSASLERMTTDLSKIQSKLINYLNEKRHTFPKFYFIGDDDLLEIIGQANDNPEVVQLHLKKLFQGINTVVFEDIDGEKYITGIVSSDGEQVNLLSHVRVTGTPSTWLSELSRESSETLKQLLFKCLAENHADVNLYPSQILSLANSITFSKQVETAISNHSLPQLKADLESQLSDLTLSKNKFDNFSINKLKLRDLILDVIKHIGIVEDLVESNTSKVSDFQWQQYLRYYVEDGDCLCKCCNSSLMYSFEYQGNAPKLVFTPLSLKAFVILTQALSLGLGGNPYGPAGTGKTETVKALAQALGRQCLVFNCDEGLDFKAMSRIFVGLLRCGSWGCFDEFNRLDINVLSAISQQIQVIQSAILEKQSLIVLNEQEISVDFNAAVFVTLNPAGKGYGGRTELPDNLKSLFRPLAMTKPDVDLIAKVLLLSEGFQSADVLAKKIVAFFSLAKVFFTSERHYDWGLRALKSVLSCAGELIATKKLNNEELNFKGELEILVKSLRLTTLPKLTRTDLEPFEQLVVDCFSSIKIDSLVSEELESAIQTTITESGLCFFKDQFDKMLQLKIALDQKLGVVIVGHASAGKSTLWRMLHKSLELTGEKINLTVINPKALHQFHDGVLIKAARDVTSATQSKSWIVFDGDVDPEWIEALNSVLDDNQLLTLPNGERIQFNSKYVNFIFETHSLEHASPATISRMGMILVTPGDEFVSTIGRQLPGNCELFGDQILSLTVEQLSFFSIKLGDPLSLLISIKAIVAMCNTYEEAAYLTVYLIKSVVDYDRSQSVDVICEPLLDCFKLHHYSFESEHFLCDVGTFHNDVSDITFHENKYFMSAHCSLYSSLILKFLNSGEPLILSGPPSSGKHTCFTAALNHYIQESNRVSLLTVDCSPFLKADYLVNAIKTSCQVVNSSKGKILRPKTGGTLVLYLRHIELLKMDKYNSVEFLNLVIQLLTENGFHDPETLEFLNIPNVSLVMTNCLDFYGNFVLNLPSRLLSKCAVLQVDKPRLSSLKFIISCYFNRFLGKSPSQSILDGLISLLSLSDDVYPSLSHSNHILTLSSLVKLIKSMTSYQSSFDTMSFDDLLCYQIIQSIGGRFIGDNAQSKFVKFLQHSFPNFASLQQVFFLPGDELTLVKKDDLLRWFSTILKSFGRDVSPVELIPTSEVVSLLSF